MTDNNWKTTTVGNAWQHPTVWPLYASVRGHLVTSIERSKTWYVLTYSSGGKRYVPAEKLLYYRSRR